MASSQPHDKVKQWRHCLEEKMSLKANFLSISVYLRRHDTQHNDIQDNDIFNDIQQYEILTTFSKMTFNGIIYIMKFFITAFNIMHDILHNDIQ